MMISDQVLRHNERQSETLEQQRFVRVNVGEPMEGTGIDCHHHYHNHTDCHRMQI